MSFQPGTNYVNGLENDFYQMLAASGIRDAKDINIDQLYIPNDTALQDQIEYILEKHQSTTI